MQRYTVTGVRWDGDDLIELGDSRTGARALIWPGFGSNCLWMRLAAPGGRTADLITPPASSSELRESPARFGTPLLFPWPGRIPGGRFSWRGREYQLPELDPAGNAIHGLVKDRPWHVEEVKGGDEEAAVRCVISAADRPDSASGYPFDWKLSVTYTLHEEGLDLTAAVANRGSEAMPFGFGAHPYFSLPFSPDGRREECLIQVPAEEKWDLDALRDLSAAEPGSEGRAAGSSALTVPLSAEGDLRRPTALGSGARDAALTRLGGGRGKEPIISTLTDPAAGLTLSVEADPDFRTIVLFSPAGRDVFCIEPWTCPPNAFNAAAQGYPDSGLLTLEPGETWQGRIRMRLG